MRYLRFLFPGLLLLIPVAVSAHEAYVLPSAFFWNTLAQPINAMAFSALNNPDNLRITLEVVGGTLIALLLNFLFRRTNAGRTLHAFFERGKWLGPHFVRIAIAAAFFFSAQSNAFLGPELTLNSLPLAAVLRVLLYIVSFLILAGLFTEIAAFIALIIFTIGFVVFGTYTITYLNYLGEIVALLLFGLRNFSIDGLLFGPLTGVRKKWEKYGPVIVRICYGLALAWAAVTVKLLHPELTLQVATHWNLMQFSWLFPPDPLLITLGAGLAELAIGLFIAFGFQLRLTVLVSLFYITLSLLFFRELVWPHVMLYGISLNLLVQPETFTLDSILFNSRRAPKRKAKSV